MAMRKSSLQPAHMCTLKRKVAAIRIARDTEPRLGLFTELLEGAQIEIYDDGFSESTVKVRAHDQFYFVFRQDLGL